MTLGQALKTPVFWSLALANFACCAAHSGPIFHMVSYAADCGVAPLTAATVLGAAGLAALSGRIICGLLADRTGAKRTLVACLALQAVAIALYLVARDLDTLYAVSMLFGFSYGGAMPLYAILVREYFPAKIMGSVFGVVAMISTLGMALGPPVGGWLFDRFGGYGWLYVASSGDRHRGGVDCDDRATAPAAPGGARGGSLTDLSQASGHPTSGNPPLIGGRGRSMRRAVFV